MEFELNPTVPTEAQSGGQAEAVAPQTETPTAAAEQESVVGSRNSDFDMVDADNQTPTAQDEPEAAGQERVVDADDGGAHAETQSGGQEAAPARADFQSPQENAAIRAARLRARREAEQELSARADEEIRASGVRDPRTGKPFESMQEFRAYGQEIRQAELAAQAQRTGRSVEELTEDAVNREFIRNLRRQEEQRAAEASAAQAQREWFERDVLDFIGKYPQFGQKELQALEANPQFRQFCGSRFGREPLATLYGDFLALVGDAGKAAVDREAQKAARSTGGGGKDGVMLSPAQKTVLDKWNAEHPEMAMTAKEFLGR